MTPSPQFDLPVYKPYFYRVVQFAIFLRADSLPPSLRGHGVLKRPTTNHSAIAKVLFGVGLLAYVLPHRTGSFRRRRVLTSLGTGRLVADGAGSSWLDGWASRRVRALSSARASMPDGAVRVRSGRHSIAGT